MLTNEKEIITRLEDIQKLADKIIGKAVRSYRRKNGRLRKLCEHEAINWARLRCDSVEHVLDIDGNEFFRVWLRKANPHCTNLCEYVRHELEKQGMKTEVCADW